MSATSDAILAFEREHTKVMFLKAVNTIMNTHWILCPNCDGEGRIGKRDGETIRDCPMCNGTGELEIREDEGLEVFHELF